MMMLAMSVKPGSKSPMCQVCNDESSGFHYGVDSCEGCKGFFRRCITQGMTHKCSNEERCEITPFTRNSCQFCRLKKCFAVGMSREASRLGRRPKRLKECDKHHTTNLPIAPYPSAAELHRLRMAELQRLLQANGTFKSELMAAFLSAEQSNFREHASPTSHSNSNDVKNCNNMSESGYSSLSSPTKSQSPIQVTPPVAAQQNNNNNNEVFYDATSMGGAADNIDPSTYGDMVTRIKSEPLTPGCEHSNQNVMMDTVNLHQQQQAFIKMEMTTSPAACNIMDDNTTNLDVLVLELQLPVPESRQLLIDTTTSVIINANLATSRYTYENLYDSELSVNSVRHQRILQEIEEELTMTDTEREKKTADDASSLWHTFIANMVPEITEVVKFCKKLPGFSEIEQEDQIKLLKQGTFEVMLTRYCILVDTKNHEMFDPDMKMKYKRDVVRAMPLGHFFEEFFNIADQVNPLNLTNDEIGLFTAMLMMSPQRMGIKNQKAVENIQQLYQQALLLHMKKSHADYEDIFKRLLCCIPTLRAVNQKHASALNNLKMSMPSKDMFPPLHTELCE